MKEAILLSVLFAPFVGAQADALKTAVISSGATTLNNGSVVNIGQPLVGVMSASSGQTIGVGFIPASRNESTSPPPVIPPYISVSEIVNGVFQLKLSSQVGVHYILLTSTNLTDWFSLLTNAATGPTLLFQDLDAPKFGYRFYRLGTE